MLVITNIQYDTKRPISPGGRMCDYRHLIVSVNDPDGESRRFLVDEQGIRVLDSPVSKGILPKKHIERLVVIRHPNDAFSVVVFFPRSLLKRGVNLLGFAWLPSKADREDLGTSFGSFRAEDVENWLRSLGYTVDLIDNTVIPRRR